MPTGVGASQSGDPRAAGREATTKALATIGDAPHAIVLLFVDSEAGDQAEIVAGAYAVAGGTVPCGRSSGRRASPGSPRTCAVGRCRCRRDRQHTPIGVGIAHGCVPRGAPSIVTRSEGPKVIQLDGRPAQDVYFERLGVDGADLGESEFNALSMVHPLAEPELSGAVRPRYVRAHRRRGLVCATTIERNAAVEICDQTPRRSSVARAQP